MNIFRDKTSRILIEKSIFPTEVVDEVPEWMNCLTVYGLISINKKIKRAGFFQ